MSKLALLLALVALGLGCRSQNHPDDDSSRIETLERENAALRRQLDVLEARLNGPSVAHTIGPPSIDALVVSVKEDLHLVVLDKGREAGVKVGDVFDVYREALYKGQVRIDEVQKVSCLGVILSEKSAIEPGDSALGSKP